MSRIGKSPIAVPEGVQVEIKDQQVTTKGKLGELNMTLVSDVAVTFGDGHITVTPANDSKRARAMWGMSRTLLSNMVTGVNEGFTKQLIVKGVGFRIAVEDKYLRLTLGYSHDIIYLIPKGITIKAPKPTELLISGADKQQVGEVAAQLRALRKPEPYKGKGVRYADERIIMKEGKKK